MTTPQRIVALSPALAELIVALGAGPRLVGASDAYKPAPDAMVADLGGSGNPDLNLLHELQPDLVLVERGHASASAAAGIAATGLQVLSAGVRGVAEVVELVEEFGQLLGVEERAATLRNAIRDAWYRAEQRLNTGLTRRVLAYTWRDPWVAVGAETYAADLLRISGGINVALQLPNRSPRVSLDRCMSFNPQIILLACDPYPFGTNDLAAFWRFGDVAAIRNRQVCLIDGRLLTRFGARTAEALDMLGALIAAC